MGTDRSGFVRGILKGVAAGAVVALLALAVGVVRLVIALASGRGMALPTGRDLRDIGFYVAGFMLAGAFLGVVWPHVRGKFAYYAAGSVAGMILMLMITVAGETSLSSVSRWSWWGAVLLGTFFGCAFTRGVLGATERQDLDGSGPTSAAADERL